MPIDARDAGAEAARLDVGAGDAELRAGAEVVVDAGGGRREAAAEATGRLVLGPAVGEKKKS